MRPGPLPVSIPAVMLLTHIHERHRVMFVNEWPRRSGNSNRGRPTTQEVDGMGRMNEADSQGKTAARYYVRRPGVIVGPFWTLAAADEYVHHYGGEVIERTAPIPTIGVADLARRNGVHR